jgi:uncharacterized membrane protein YedE/YeeE
MSHDHSQPPKPYSNPYLTGFGLGLVLLATYLIMGRGLGASGAVSSVVATFVNWLAPEHAMSNEFYTNYLPEDGVHPLKDWLVFQALGVFVGGLFSGLLAHRVKVEIMKGPNITNRSRIILAFIGGAFVGFGAKLARGCASGLALTGGGLLSLGAWAFMLSIFVGGYLFAYLLRRQWI